MKSKYIKGFIAGSMLGVAAGMLLMPEINTDMRKRVMDAGKNMMGSASQMIPGMKQK